MYLKIRATASRFEPMPLFGRSLNVVFSVAEARKVKGRTKECNIGCLGCVSVPCTSAEAVLRDSFWQDVRQRMDEFGVPPEKREVFTAQIENVLAAVATAKRDPETRKRLESKPNQVLTEIRKRMDGGLAEGYRP